MKSIICLFIAAAIQLNAQDSLLKVRAIHYRLDYGFGVRLIDNVSNVNRELVSNGYPEISTMLTGFEFGLHLKRKKLGIGIFERIYWGNGKESNQREFSPSSFGADLRATYNLSKNPKFGIEPLMGLGYQTFDFKLRGTEIQPFSSALQNPPPRPLNLEYGSSLFYGGVSLSTRIRNLNSNYGQWNAYLGLQVVYNFCYGIWAVNDNWVDSKDELSGWQIKFVASVEAVVAKRRRW